MFPSTFQVIPKGKGKVLGQRVGTCGRQQPGLRMAPPPPGPGRRFRTGEHSRLKEGAFTALPAQPHPGCKALPPSRWREGEVEVFLYGCCRLSPSASSL